MLDVASVGAWVSLSDVFVDQEERETQKLFWTVCGHSHNVQEERIGTSYFLLMCRYLISSFILLVDALCGVNCEAEEVFGVFILAKFGIIYIHNKTFLIEIYFWY